MGYYICSCGRVFQTSSLLDKVMEKKNNIQLFCPKCGSTEVGKITKKMYLAREKDRFLN